jgi:hypothetical protein
VQQEDLTALGKVIIALACRSLMAVQRENMQTSLDLVSRTYSSDLRNVIMYVATYVVYELRTFFHLLDLYLKEE